MQPDLPESKQTPNLLNPDKKTSGLSKFLTGGAGSQMQVHMKRLSQLDAGGTGAGGAITARRVYPNSRNASTNILNLDEDSKVYRPL